MSLLSVNHTDQYCDNLFTAFKHSCILSDAMIETCCEYKTSLSDCAKSGVYKTHKGTSTGSDNVYCDMDMMAEDRI